MKRENRILLLSVFSFDCRLDFQNGYVRCQISYRDDTMLRDVLRSIPHDGFSNREFGLMEEIRLNNIVVFHDVPVKELVGVFGHIWYVEPISSRYAKKDLIINYDIALKKYEQFFRKHTFIKGLHRDMLLDYLKFNFIVQDHFEDYLGDGFFMYVRALIDLYPSRESELLDYIAGSIMQHVPTASLMYPNDDCVDEVIRGLQRRCGAKKFSFSVKPSIEYKGMPHVYSV